MLVVPAVTASATAVAAAGPSRTAAPDPATRVLVLSVPTVIWSDVQPATMPNLYGLLAQGAIGDLSTLVAVNDSGISIPVVMIGVVNSTLVFVVFLLWKLAPDLPPVPLVDDPSVEPPDPVVAGVGAGAP